MRFCENVEYCIVHYGFTLSCQGVGTDQEVPPWFRWRWSASWHLPEPTARKVRLPTLVDENEAKCNNREKDLSTCNSTCVQSRAGLTSWEKLQNAWGPAELQAYCEHSNTRVLLYNLISRPVHEKGPCIRSCFNCPRTCQQVNQAVHVNHILCIKSALICGSTKTRWYLKSTSLPCGRTIHLVTITPMEVIAIT